MTTSFGPTFILGLTGSIGMGKTTAANAFRLLGVPVHDADGVVHRLLGPGGRALDQVEAAFPGVTGPGGIDPGGIDRKRLGDHVFDDPAALKRLEKILHPLVSIARNKFLQQVAKRRQPMALLDVPLLFETGGEKMCHAVAVVSAPAFLQRIRVLGRPGMNAEKFRSILAKQMPDLEKRRRGDIVIETGLGRARSLRQIKNIVRVIKTRDH